MCGIAGFVGAVPKIGGGNVDNIAQAMAASWSIADRTTKASGSMAKPERRWSIAASRSSICRPRDISRWFRPTDDTSSPTTAKSTAISRSPPSLRRAAHKFRGDSDTEVILESFAANGIEATLKRMIGMFAIALWDRRERTLTLIRDRLGIKPLYWAKFGELFLFGSELKALRAHPGWTPRIDQSAVAAFMRHNYIPAPHTIYEGVHKLEPGTCSPCRGKASRASRASGTPARGARRHAQPACGQRRRIDRAIGNAAAGRRRPPHDRRRAAGRFLSGGIDSSTVVALMQAAGAGKVKTFSIGFDIPGLQRGALCGRGGAASAPITPNYRDSRQALDVIPRLPEWYDEPFADSSQIPTYLVSAMTRRHVTVALSGDGGDELFAGYNRYQLTQRFWRALSLMPRSVRKAAPLR